MKYLIITLIVTMGFICHFATGPPYEEYSEFDDGFVEPYIKIKDGDEFEISGNTFLEFDGNPDDVAIIIRGDAEFKIEGNIFEPNLGIEWNCF